MRCPGCGNAELDAFFEGGRIPVLCNQLWPDRSAAEGAPLGEMQLGLCSACGLIHNIRFDPERIEYSGDYENSLHFSPRFQEYAESLAERLVERHGLRGKQIVEIGCGKGEFLGMICGRGGNRGLGFDASYEGPERVRGEGCEYRVVRDPFTGQDPELSADLVLSRHVLEHIARPLPFLEQVRAVAARRPGCRVFFEVPDGLYTLRDMGIWDLIYEHCSYFTGCSLARLFETAGMQVREVRSDFGGQFLSIDATASAGAEPGRFRAEVAPQDVAAMAAAFAGHHRRKIEQWNERLGSLVGAGEGVAVWGAGSKGVTFLNRLAAGREVRFVVDINTRKHGQHVPGTGQPVVAPQALRGQPVGTVLVMNGIYRAEIESALADLGVRASVEVV
jgi:SAM-dependent methyltransferase